MKKNENVVGDCKCDQFYQVKVCGERDEDCAECLQISGRPYLRPVQKTKDHQPYTSRTVQQAVLISPPRKLRSKNPKVALNLWQKLRKKLR